MVGGDDEEGEEDVGGEGDDGVDKESECADSRSFFPFFFDFFRREVWVGGKVGVAVELPDVGGHVEEKAEPAHPVEELGFADFADLRGQAEDCVEDLAEEGEKTWRSIWRGTFETRVALTDVEGGYKDCTAKGERGDDAEDLKLGLP